MADIVTLHEPASPAPKPRKRRRPKRTVQIARMQDVLLAGIESGDVKLSEAAQATRAWVDSEAMRREILGLGKPKPVEPVNADKAKRKRQPLPEPTPSKD